MSTTSPPRTARGPLHAVGRYARLVKYKFVIDFLLALVIVATLLGPAALVSGTTPLALLFFALGMLGVLAAVMTLDDVTGAQDGSDTANYVETPSGQLRPLSRKPLLTGEITVRDARAFGIAGLVWGVLWWAAALLYAPGEPWVIVTMALLAFLSVQYSWGLKFSYYGLGEAVLLFSAAAFLIAPYGLVTGQLPLMVLVQGLLFGFGQLLIAGYSNTNDVRGDAEAGRRTVAVLTSESGNKVFLAVLTCVNIAVIVVPVAVGALPWTFLLVLAPFVVLRVRQYAGFLRTGDPLVARSRGIWAFRTVVACLLLFNVLEAVL
ncbi:UbiA family prenyltransferase [Nocardiopsis sp. NPDC006139]|uniref:UbiA family prenyltransferase n=1 Tax=unclassified Nocardiopsis TaxID=2649073 RepID=UPI0033B50C02